MLYKKSKKIQQSRRKTYGIFLILVFTLAIGAAGYVAKLNYASASPDGKNSTQGLNESPTAYKNLDLSIAATATYPSKPIEVIKDLGVARGVSHKTVRFEVVKDKLSEYGLMTQPTTPPPSGGYPVLLLLHGYVNPLYYSTEEAYLGDMEFYSQRGYAVIKPDLRGQGLSIGAGSAEGAYYSMAYNTDLMSLISAVKLTANLNDNKINLWGHSMGAYIALRASVLSPDIKNTIILSGPVGSIRDMYNAYVAISDTGNQTAGAIRAAALAAKGTPNSNPDYWEKTSPLNYLNKSKSFYQIHIGSSDRIVPPKFSSDLERALSGLNKPNEYFVYQGGDHGLLGVRNSIWARSVYRLDQTK